VKDKDLYIQLLRDAGLKATNQRINVVQFFDSVKKPICVNDIENNINNIDNATIYRIINILVNKGIIKIVHICGDSKFFELSALPHHHHIICKKCGIIEDVNDCNLMKVVRDIELKSKNFDKISEHTFELFGFCKKCK
jgi:Fur family ferric uptake transcriptional regulator